MTPADKIAALGVGTVCAAPSLIDHLRAVNEWLHTGTYIVGIIAGLASVVYYWTNRRREIRGATGKTGKTGAAGVAGPQGEKGDPA